MGTRRSSATISSLHNCTQPPEGEINHRSWHVLPIRAQELCESRGGRPGLSILMSLTVSVDVKQHWTMLRQWSQFVPNMSTDIRGHEALHRHHRHHHHHHHHHHVQPRAQELCESRGGRVGLPSLINQSPSVLNRRDLNKPTVHSSGAVWESRWPSWAVRPNEPSGFRGRKAILNHASALVSACP